MINQIDIAVPILTSLLTGGFLLFFIENQHIEKEVSERFYSLMKPFYRNLTLYLRFLSTCRNAIIYDKEQSENILALQSIMDKLGRLGGQTIIEGRNIPILDAKKIDQICNDINNIWYYYDKSNTKCHISFDNNEFIKQHIKESLLDYSAKYNDSPINLDLLPKVSGDFFVEVWQPVQDISYEYEYWQKKCQCYNWFIFGSIILIITVLLSILIIPEFKYYSILFTALTVISCIVFGILIFRMVKLMNISNRIIH